jgi:hypothetical protein
MNISYRFSHCAEGARRAGYGALAEALAPKVEQTNGTRKFYARFKCFTPGKEQQTHTSRIG